MDAIAAVFDLEGFTTFCKQIDPHLSVPIYLSRFLDWLIDQLKKHTIRQHHREGSRLWHPLPFFLKYMGDGLLVLWDCEEMKPVHVRNVILHLARICSLYQTELLKTLNGLVADAPPTLRCGVARGVVYSVGDDSDYVGSCINMAARIQKLPGLVFAFNRRGVDLDEEDASEFFKTRIKVQKVAIRGIGENELICVRLKDLESMNPADRKLYREP